MESLPAFNYFSFFHPVFLAANPQGITQLIVVLLVLIFLTFIISGAEVALFSLKSKEIDMLKTKQQPAARRIIHLLKEPKEVYASLMIAGTFINICVIILLNFLFDEYFSLKNYPFAIEIFSKILAIFFVLVFFGKVLPKVWAAQNNLRFAYGSVIIVEIIYFLLHRISKWIVSLADGIGKRMGANITDSLNLRELDQAIDFKPDDEVSQDEKNILKGIVKFGNITVKQIMRSRLDINGIEYNTPHPELLQKIEELHYSRLPVYKNDLDQVAGIINTKDLIAHLGETDQFDWHPLMRQPFFVPESKLIEDLMLDFQSKKIHIAVVVDEFGGTSGIVTMEDIMEEIVGEIKDEFDEEENRNRKLDDQNYIFEGKTMLHDICRSMQLPINTFDGVRGDSESLGGLLLELAGKFPSVNEIILCKALPDSSTGFEFTVLESDKKRVTLVKVSLKPKPVL